MATELQGLLVQVVNLPNFLRGSRWIIGSIS
jgi:hypothetical protein